MSRTERLRAQQLHSKFGVIAQKTTLSAQHFAICAQQVHRKYDEFGRPAFPFLSVSSVKSVDESVYPQISQMTQIKS
jgi:hypothetical protein